jgi:hypothetical protein
MDDPITTIFYLDPFVVVCTAAITFNTMKGILSGTPVCKGLMFGTKLVCIMTSPSMYAMITSMIWPVDFYISTMIWEIIYLSLVGILFT